MQVYHSAENGSGVPTFGDLNRDSARANYNSFGAREEDFWRTEPLDPNEVYGKHSFVEYVSDEVCAMLDTMFCENRYLTATYNPIYWVFYFTFFLLHLPGALFHWGVLGYIPVRKAEFPEERDLRSQGIYTALGAALINIPFAFYGFTEGEVINQDAQLEVDNGLALLLTLTLVLVNLIALVAISYEYTTTLRVYAMGAFMVVVFLVFLSLYAVKDIITATDASILVVQYTIRILLIFVYSFIALQCLATLNAYDAEVTTKPERQDMDKTLTLVLLGAYTIFGVCAVTAYILAAYMNWGLF